MSLSPESCCKIEQNGTTIGNDKKTEPKACWKTVKFWSHKPIDLKYISHKFQDAQFKVEDETDADKKGDTVNTEPGMRRWAGYDIEVARF